MAARERREREERGLVDGDGSSSLRKLRLSYSLSNADGFNGVAASDPAAGRTRRTLRIN